MNKKESGKSTGGIWRSGQRVHDLTIDEAFKQGIPAQVYERIQRAKRRWKIATSRKSGKDIGHADVMGKK